MNETSVSTQGARSVPAKQKRKPSMLLSLWVLVALLHLYLVMDSLATAFQLFMNSEPASTVAMHDALADVDYRIAIATVVWLMLAVAWLIDGLASKRTQ